MGLLDFLFGKDPDIFDEKGQVRHRFTENKWSSWNDRFRSSEYDWRQHKGRAEDGKGTKPTLESKSTRRS